MTQVALIRSGPPAGFNDMLIAPLGLMYLSATIRSHDYDPHIVDLLGPAKAARRIRHGHHQGGAGAVDWDHLVPVGHLFGDQLQHPGAPELDAEGDPIPITEEAAPADEVVAPSNNAA